MVGRARVRSLVKAVKETKRLTMFRESPLYACTLCIIADKNFLNKVLSVGTVLHNIEALGWPELEACRLCTASNSRPVDSAPHHRLHVPALVSPYTIQTALHVLCHAELSGVCYIAGCKHTWTTCHPSQSASCTWPPQTRTSSLVVTNRSTCIPTFQLAS